MGGTTAAIQVDERFIGDHLSVARLGKQPQAGQQLCRPPIGLVDQRIPGRLQGQHLGILGKALDQGLLQIQGPRWLQRHRLRRGDGDIKGDVDQVADLALATQPQGISLLKPVLTLLQGRIGPEQIQPGNQSRALQGGNFPPHDRVVVDDGLPDPRQLLGQLKPVVGQADVELQLA